MNHPESGLNIKAGSFILEKLLHRDNTSDTYRAEVASPVYHLQKGEKISLKIIFPDRFDDPHLRLRVQREVELGMLVSSPNVARIYGIEEIESLFGRECIAIIMELIEGKVLRQYIEQQKLFTEIELQDIARQSCTALNEIHEKGAIHRNVTPDNLLLTKMNRLVLLNMGIAKIIDFKPKLTTTGMFMGTWAYASPEQMTGESIDQRSDLFSLGIVLYELATGENPFRATSLMEALTIHQVAEPEDPGEKNKDISKGMRHLIMMLLAKNRDLRPPSAVSVLKMLEKL
ncbi:serine/threonine protein kinase [bacterium]|nr:serine/threonine protein kinase [candidate division CSSED10-310 bacterium]